MGQKNTEEKNLKTKIKHVLTIGAAVTTIAFLSGCASTPEPVKQPEPPKPVEAPKPAPAPVPAPVAAPAPAPAPTPAPPKPVTISAQALFDFDKATLTNAGKAVLDQQVVARKGDLASISFTMVTGHADRMGSHEYNQKLSERRAEAVMAYLVSKGIPSDVIDTMGAGKTQPVPGITCADKLPRAKLIDCLAPNRRVVVELKGMPK